MIFINQVHINLFLLLLVFFCQFEFHYLIVTVNHMHVKLINNIVKNFHFIFLSWRKGERGRLLHGTN